MDTASIIFILAVIGLLICMAIWAAAERRKQRRKMQEEINLGDHVRTMGGICGTVVSFTEKELTIESGNKGSEIIVTRDAVSAVTREK